MENWTTLEEFLLYEVSDHGGVRNIKTGRILRAVPNGGETLMVTLRKDGRNHHRSVRRLVAETFLGNPEESDPFQTYSVILLDGDPYNNHVNNLDWRPRWYAIKWGQQLRATRPKRNNTIQSFTTGEVWPDSLACAMDIGALEDQVIWAAGQHSRIKIHDLRFV